MTTKITKRWTTVATVGYQSINAIRQNPSAHGGVCHLQARKGANGPIGRKVNTNGRHDEVGESFALDADTLERWERIARDSR